MKTYQLSFPLPISLLEYNVGEKFVAYYLENHIIQDSVEENVHYDQPQINSDSSKDSMHLLDKFSIPITKIYQLYPSLPAFAKELFNHKIIKIREEKTQSFPKSSCTYTIENIEGIKVNIQTYCIDGLHNNESPFSTKEATIPEVIDILNLGEESITQQEIEQIKSHFRITKQRRWIQERSSGVTVYNLVDIQVNYPEVREELENILKELVNQFLIYQRKLLLFHYEKWMTYGNQNLKKLESEVKMQSPRKEKARNLFSDHVSTYNNLSTKLNLNKAIEIFWNKRAGRDSTQRNLFASQDNFKQKKSKIQKKTGNLYKRGDGPINFNWNPRYFILDRATLFYFSDATDKTPRGMTKLTDATVSPIEKFEEREYVFRIEIPSLSRTFYLSGETKQETEEWRDAIKEAISSNLGVSLENPNFVRSFTSIDAEEKPKKSFIAPAGRGSIEMRLTSPNKRSSGRKTTETSPMRGSHLGRSLFKTKSRVFNELGIQTIPEAIQHLEATVTELKNIDKEKWQVKNFRNGVKILNQNEKSKGATKVGFKSWSVYAIFLGIILLSTGDIMIKVALLGFMFCLYFLNQLHTVNKGNREEVIGRVIVEEDALKIFQKVKKLKVRTRWDLNIRNLNKLDKSHRNRDKRNKPYEVDLILPPVKWPFFDGLTTLKCRVDKWNFIHDEDTFVIVEVSTLNDPILKMRNCEFKMTEILIAQRFSKLSGKCLVTLQNNITTNFLSAFQLAKLRKDRIRNLSIIRDFLSEEFFYDQVQDIESDDEDRESDYVEDNVQAEDKASIILPATANSNPNSGQFPMREREKKTSILRPRADSISSQNGVVKLATRDGFDWENRKDFNEDIMAVDSLIQGTLEKRCKALEERRPGYKILKTGGIECCNADEIKSQEGIVIELMKTAGKTLMEGKNVVGISLPVRIFEPRSSIERMCDSWAFGPIYLNRAVHASDPVERMKNVMTFCISGLYMNCKQMKPFNPIIGETYQGYWPDGTALYCEHTSHHPPITTFFVEDVKKNYTYSGYYELKGQLKGNSVVAQQFGPNNIKFADGTKIHYILPPFKLNGLLFGSRTIEFQTNIVFTDEKNNLEAKLTFYENPSLFSKNLHPSDYFEGTITKLSDKNKVYSKFAGQWTSYIEFDGQRYWDLKFVDPILHVHTTEPLPSDCRYREDLIYLERKDLAKSQEHKIRLEKIQRADRKLRNDYKENLEKNS